MPNPILNLAPGWTLSGRILTILDKKWAAPLGAPSAGGAAGRRGEGWVLGFGGGGVGDPELRGRQGVGGARGTLCRGDSARIFAFASGRDGGGGAVPTDCGRGPGELIRKRRQPRGPNSTCHREAEVETEREKASDLSRGKSCAPPGNYKNVTPRAASKPPPSPAAPNGPPAAAPCPRPPSMRPPRSEYRAAGTRARVGRGGAGQEEAEPRYRSPGGCKQSAVSS